MRALALLLACASAGCSSPSSPSPPTPPPVLRSEDYRFELRAPDASWRLRERLDFARSTVATAIRTGTAATRRGAVSLARTGTLTLEESARRFIGGNGLEAHATAPRLTEHDGRPAIRFAVSQDAGSLRGEHLMLAEGGWLYHLRSEDPLLLPGFHVLGGRVGARAPARFGDARGPDWILRDGVFESASAAVAVRAPAGFRPHAEPPRRGADGIVGLQSFDGMAALRLHAALVPEGAPWAGSLRAALERLPCVSEGEPVPVVLDGRPLTLARCRVDGDLLVYSGQLREAGRPALEIEIDVAALLDDELRARFPAMFGALELLDRARTEALWAELERGPAFVSAEPSGATRGRVARSFSEGIGFRAPAGPWALWIGDSDDLAFVARAPRLGLRVDVELVWGASPRELLDAIARSASGRGGRRASLGAAEALVGPAKDGVAEARIARRLGHRIVLATVWGPATALDPSGPLLPELAAGIFAEPRAPLVVEQERSRDLRFGLALDLASSTHRRLERSSREGDSELSAVTFSSKDSVLTVSSFPARTYPRPEGELARLLEDLWLARVCDPALAQTASAAVPLPAALAGLEGLSVMARGVSVNYRLTVIERGGLVHVFNACASSAAADVDGPLASLRWLDD